MSSQPTIKGPLMRHTDRIVIVGFGSIAQALLPLLAKHYDAEIIIFDKVVDEWRNNIAKAYSASLKRKFISEGNFRETLSPLLSNNSFLLNLAVSVSSTALIELAQQYKSLYLDTCIEPWEYHNQKNNILTSNHDLRENLKKNKNIQTGTTALVAHGANPGFISILLKKAILEMAKTNKINNQPATQSEWAELASKLGIKVIQISERDTQTSSNPRKPNNFMCTWSVDGFITECLQPAEMGWGSHEDEMPYGATIKDHSIELADQGREVTVKS